MREYETSYRSSRIKAWYSLLESLAKAIEQSKLPDSELEKIRNYVERSSCIWRYYSIFENVNLDSGSALDIGSGDGLLALIMSKMNRNTIALDISASGLQNAKAINREFHSSLFHAVRADAHFLPIRDGSFELVIISSTLEFLDRPIDVIREANHLMKKTGNLLVIVSNAIGIYGLFRRAMLQPWLRLAIGLPKEDSAEYLRSIKPRCYFSQPEVEAMLLQSGLEKKKRIALTTGMSFVLNVVKRILGKRRIIDLFGFERRLQAVREVDRRIASVLPIFSDSNLYIYFKEQQLEL